MKTSIRLVVLTAFAALFIPCVSARAQSAHGLEVSDPQWRYLAGREAPDYKPAFASDRVSAGSSAMTTGTHEVSALFHNAGTKTVKSVVWEYIFFKDTAQTQIKRKHTFRDGKTIRPGESLRSKRWLVRARENGFVYDAARIVRVEYEDGTVWRAAKQGS